MYMFSVDGGMHGMAGKARALAHSSIGMRQVTCSMFLDWACCAFHAWGGKSFLCLYVHCIIIHLRGICTPLFTIELDWNVVVYRIGSLSHLLWYVNYVQTYINRSGSQCLRPSGILLLLKCNMEFSTIVGICCGVSPWVMFNCWQHDCWIRCFY